MVRPTPDKISVIFYAGAPPQPTRENIFDSLQQREQNSVRTSVVDRLSTLADCQKVCMANARCAIASGRNIVGRRIRHEAGNPISDILARDDAAMTETIGQIELHMVPRIGQGFRM